MRTPFRPALISFILSVVPLAALAGCGDDDSPVDATMAEADARPDASADAGEPVIDAALPDGAPDASPPDAIPPDAAEPDVATNNGATIDGADVEGNMPLSRTELTLVPTGDSPIRVDYGYATGASGTFIRYVFHVTNHGTQDYCGIELLTVILDADGHDLGPPVSHFLNGSVRLWNGVTTDTCLGAGEAGWAIAIDDELDFADVAGARITVAMDDGPVAEPQARVLPTSYSFASFDLAVTGENQGSARATVGIVLWIPLDPDGRPLAWDYANFDATSIDPGASHQFTEVAFFGGTMAQAAFRFSFHDAPGAAAASPRAARIAAARAETLRMHQRELAARALYVSRSQAQWQVTVRRSRAGRRGSRSRRDPRQRG